MFSDLSVRIDAQKLAVRLVEKDDIAIRIGDDNAIVDIVQDELQKPEPAHGGALITF